MGDAGHGTLERTGAAAKAGATARIATFATGYAPSQEAVACAVSCIVDTLAVTLAGGAEPQVRRLASALSPRGDDGDARPSFWSHDHHGPEDAALLYGMASHILDYDDVSMVAICHASAPVLSASLAAAPWDAVSGRALAEALVVGTEVALRIGEAMGFRHYDLGFHATGTLGAVGAAAAAARLMRLDEATTGHALSIAASSASGLRKNFGSMVKSLHVGLAAASGVRAARLAAAGLAGAHEVMESGGFLRAFSGGACDDWPETVVLGAPPAILSPGFEQKRYPCCYLLHKIIEATRELRAANGLTLESVTRARVEMPPGGTRPLIHPCPETPLEALFSGPYAVLASIADGTVNLASFTPAAVARPEIRARLATVDVREREGAAASGGEVGAAPVTVTLTLSDGREVSATCTVSPGSPQDPLGEDGLRAKWSDCIRRANPAVDEGLARAVVDDGFALAAMASIGPWLREARALLLAADR